MPPALPSVLAPLLAAALVLLFASFAWPRPRFLAVLQGPLGLAAGGALLLLAFARTLSGQRLRHAMARRAARPVRSRRLFVVGALVHLGLGLHYASGLRVFGDEPHYLLMAQSLWREGDLDLQDNLARQDWQEYTPGPVAPHYGAPRADGRPFPAHSPGLPLFLAPLYAASGRLACVAFLALCAAGAAAVSHRLALRLTNDPAAALGAWAAAVGPPLLFFAFHVYTEAPSALLAAGGLLLLTDRRPGEPPVSSRRAVAAALAAAALPWIHVKMIPAAGALGVVALVRLRGRPQAAFVVVAAAMAMAFFGYYHAIFGIASPLALYGGAPVGERGSIPRALVGLLLDRSFGLLTHAPVFVLAIAGLVAWRPRSGPAAEPMGPSWPLLLLGASVVLPVLPWRMWWAGQSPPARFLVPMVPVLAVLVAVRLAQGRRGLARWFAPLLLVTHALAVYMAWDPGALRLVNRGDRPTRVWASLSGEVAVGDYLPSLIAGTPADWVVAACWVTAILVVLALDSWSRRNDGADRLFSGMPFPLVLLATLGAVLDALRSATN